TAPPGNLGPHNRSGAVTTVTLAIQVAAPHRIGRSVWRPACCSGRVGEPAAGKGPAVSGRAISIDGPSAVDEQGLTGDVARRVAGQEHDGSIEFVEPRGPAQRRVALYPCHLLWVAEKSRLAGRGKSPADRPGPDTVLSPFRGQGPGRRHPPPPRRAASPPPGTGQRSPPP